MHILNDICNNLEYQLEDVVKKNDWTPNELDIIYKSVKTMYYIKTIKAMEEYSYDDSYSRASGGNNSNRGYYRDGGMSNDYGYSYRRGRYSRDNEKDINRELGDMMSKATSDVERQTIAKLMDRLG